jgi:hypothetical protein
MSKIRAYWRAFRGYCPACNLDAPAIDTCQVCHNYRGEFPPPPAIAAGWLMLYFDEASEVPGDYRVTVSGQYLQYLIQCSQGRPRA